MKKVDPESPPSVYRGLLVRDSFSPGDVIALFPNDDRTFSKVPSFLSVV